MTSQFMKSSRVVGRNSARIERANKGAFMSSAALPEGTFNSYRQKKSIRLPSKKRLLSGGNLPSILEEEMIGSSIMQSL